MVLVHAERGLFPTMTRAYLIYVIVTYMMLNLFEYHEYKRVSIFNFNYLWVSLVAPLITIIGLFILAGVVVTIVSSLYLLYRKIVEKKE